MYSILRGTLYYFYRIIDRICRKYVIASFKPKEHFNNASQSSRNIKIFNEYKFRICSTYLTHRGESLNKKF